MRIGIVCPYSFDTPGGVQFHVRDLAEVLIGEGHDVSVLAPADPDQNLPSYVTSVGRAIPVRYNGSVARLAFGPRVSRSTQQWLEEGNFDVVHIHEPFVPSCSIIALRHAQAPIVATFHSAQERSVVLALAEPFTRPGFERINARIAVSADARRTILDHFEKDSIVIPNGVFVDRFRRGNPRSAWQGKTSAPTIAFLGRVEEPRKGLSILLEAIPSIREEFPGARFLIAGTGEFEYLGPHAHAIERLGPLTEEEKIELLSSVDLYLAPQIGGESFGIVLVEAMAAGAAIVASDLSAFEAVLDGGRAGFLFERGSPSELARTVIEALGSPAVLQEKKAHGALWVESFDWSVVAREILEIYRTVSLQSDLFGPDRPGMLLRVARRLRRRG